MTKFIEMPANKMSIVKRSLKFGMGVNDATYIVQTKSANKTITCPYYRCWVDMITRCYSKSFQTRKPTYVGCSVAKEWLIFSNFRKWMETQDWQGKSLDKDLLVEGNKTYSPETCIFVSVRLNNLLGLRARQRGKYLLGVGKLNNSTNFYAQCNDMTGKSYHLGSFKTEQEAHQAYCAYKANLITEVANKQTDLRLKNALLRRAETIHLVA